MKIYDPARLVFKSLMLKFQSTAVLAAEAFQEWAPDQVVNDRRIQMQIWLSMI